MARWRRNVKRGLLGLFGLVVIVVVLALLALAHLDARPMKSWVRGAAASRGIALDFDVGRVTLGGLRLVNIRIASPAADAAVAPDLFAIGAIEGQWSPLSRRIDELVIRDVALTVVRNADGTTSLDRWLAGLPGASPPPSPSPATNEPADPLSALGRALVPVGSELHARIEGVTVSVIDRRKDGAVAQRMILTGFTAKAEVANGTVALALGPGALRLAIEPGRVITGATPGTTPEATPGTTPEVTPGTTPEATPGTTPEATPGAASGAVPATRELVVDLHGEAKLLAGGHGSVSFEATLERQTLAPELPPIKQLVSLAATIDFDPERRRTTLHVEQLRLLDGAATLTAHAHAEDVAIGGAPGIRPVVEALAMRLDLPAIARAIPAELGPVEAEGEPIVVTIKDAAAAPSLQGMLAASGTVVRARWRDLALRGLRLGINAQPVGGDGARGELTLTLDELALPGLTVREVGATVFSEHPAGAASAAGPRKATAP
ncbi:MAG TPA: hypothetical protein VHN14_10485, partial [Kofleriaceae bacterium]|nr:hypothetical protein [Kofleriaceae bacterium]